MKCFLDTNMLDWLIEAPEHLNFPGSRAPSVPHRKTGQGTAVHWDTHGAQCAAQLTIVLSPRSMALGQDRTQCASRSSQRGRCAGADLAVVRRWEVRQLHHARPEILPLQSRAQARPQLLVALTPLSLPLVPRPELGIGAQSRCCGRRAQSGRRTPSRVPLPRPQRPPMLAYSIRWSSTAV